VDFGCAARASAEVTDDDVGRLKLREPKGVLVRSVMPGEPADKGGMRADDVILGIDGTTLESPRDLQRVVSSMPVGKKVRVVLLREGQETELEVTIGLYQEREGSPARRRGADRVRPSLPGRRPPGTPRSSQARARGSASAARVARAQGSSSVGGGA